MKYRYRITSNNYSCELDSNTFGADPQVMLDYATRQLIESETYVCVEFVSIHKGETKVLHRLTLEGTCEGSEPFSREKMRG